MARAASEVYVAKGKKVVHFDIKRDRPGDDELLPLLLGPSGYLRAPAIRAGKLLLIGFELESFSEILG